MTHPLTKLSNSVKTRPSDTMRSLDSGGKRRKVVRACNKRREKERGETGEGGEMRR